MAGAFPRPHLFISKGTHMGYSNELEVTNLLLTTNLLQQTNELQVANALWAGGGQPIPPSPPGPAPGTYGFELEDGTGVILLENGGILLLENQI